MVRHSKPRAGSLAFWPRKRAKRIYPIVKTWPETEKTRILGFAGYKAGMTHAIILDTRKGSPTMGEEISVPVTVLECPPIRVIGIRAYEETHDGYAAFTEVWDENVKKDKELGRKIIPGDYNTKKAEIIEKNLNKIKKLRLIVCTQPKHSGLKKKKPEIFEIEVSGNDIHEKWEYCKGLLGKELSIKDVFREGEFIDAIGVTKGKGTTGPVKRFGVKIQTRKATKKRRHIGSLGSVVPRRVLWTVPMAGQLGFFKRTEFNKRILKIGEEGKNITPKSGFVNYGIVKNEYVLLEGSVPGPKKRLIIMRAAVRPPKQAILPPEIRYVEK